MLGCATFDLNQLVMATTNYANPNGDASRLSRFAAFPLRNEDSASIDGRLVSRGSRVLVHCSFVKKGSGDYFQQAANLASEVAPFPAVPLGRNGAQQDYQQDYAELSRRAAAKQAALGEADDVNARAIAYQAAKLQSHNAAVQPNINPNAIPSTFNQQIKAPVADRPGQAAGNPYGYPHQHKAPVRDRPGQAAYNPTYSDDEEDEYVKGPSLGRGQSGPSIIKPSHSPSYHSHSKRGHAQHGQPMPFILQAFAPPKPKARSERSNARSYEEQEEYETWSRKNRQRRRDKMAREKDTYEADRDRRQEQRSGCCA